MMNASGCGAAPSPPLPAGVKIALMAAWLAKRSSYCCLRSQRPVNFRNGASNGAASTSFIQRESVRPLSATVVSSGVSSQAAPANEVGCTQVTCDGSSRLSVM